MTVEKKKIRRGAFVFEEVHVKLGKTPPAPEDIGAFLEILCGASPTGLIAAWKPHAERLGVGLEDLVKAEGLIDEQGTVDDTTAFDLHMERAKADIQIAQNEETIVPVAKYGIKTQEERRRGGQNSHEMKAQDRQERNEYIQKEVDRLMLNRGLSFRRAATLIGPAVNLHPDTVRKIATNPKKVGR